MIADKIKALREEHEISQSELARQLNTTRASINAWEQGISAPTAQYIIALAKFFHVSSDFILELDTRETISISSYTTEEKNLLFSLIKYFDNKE